MAAPASSGALAMESCSTASETGLGLKSVKPFSSAGRSILIGPAASTHFAGAESFTAPLLAQSANSGESVMVVLSSVIEAMFESQAALMFITPGTVCALMLSVPLSNEPARVDLMVEAPG